jgi:hypothetical protein
MPIAGLGLLACQDPKKQFVHQRVQAPITKLELPLTPSADALKAITIEAVVDAEAGRGGAPNNQGEALERR